MPNIKLKNVSQRKFTIGEKGDLLPGKSVTLGQAEATLLLSLYPGELVDVVAEAATPDDESDSQPAPAPLVDAIEDMKVPALREALKAKGISFKPAASKADLVALLKGADAPAPAPLVDAPTPAEPIAPTPLPGADVALEEGTVYVDDAGALFVGAKQGETVGLLPVSQLTDEEKAPLVAQGKLTA